MVLALPVSCSLHHDVISVFTASRTGLVGPSLQSLCAASCGRASEAGGDLHTSLLDPLHYKESPQAILSPSCLQKAFRVGSSLTAPSLLSCVKQVVSDRLDPLDGSTPHFSCPSHYRRRQEHQPCHNSVLRTRATYNQALHLHATQVTFSPVPVELLCPVLAGFMSI